MLDYERHSLRKNQLVETIDNFQGRNNFIEYMVDSFSYIDLNYHISYSNFLFDRFIVYEKSQSIILLILLIFLLSMIQIIYLVGLY